MFQCRFAVSGKRVNRTYCSLDVIDPMNRSYRESVI